ncbi:hypothetical protein FJ417_09515 [Mesorhizobium sp. B3-1-7]|uniref:hypothetical protein n=1 Tax=Mesorhizobium sp. B3-1-7 TaxID=2589894 RepID=UPI00112EB333|nr:hypothetical protein [Mesorhizobium sp. B3-1-7]TPI61923.1 hypothetical protein FJ417_08685 [Mesorhizobium sp. B3-1-7]TPI62068.1 hypothetical protein FJ417_09515 [Mesorhizobium sp. B3-1-7]
MRRLEDYEEIALIGYPCDGEYIAVMANGGQRNWLLGGELCEWNGAILADQAAALLRYYPRGSRLVLVTIKGDNLVAIRDCDTATGPAKSQATANAKPGEGQAGPAEDARLADFRAAAMLRDSASMSFDPATEIALSTIAARMKLGRMELIRVALREWLAMRAAMCFPPDEGAPYGSQAPDGFG